MSVTPGPSFRFRLERVRALRERTEDMARQELAEAMMRRSRCEEDLLETERTLDRACAQHLEAQQDSDALEALRGHQAFIERLEQTREAAIANLRAHEAEVQSRLDALGEAARERQTLERLKERRRADHQREADRVEGATLDELAINSHRRMRAT
jgi:flagellar FliJ protein